MSEIDILLSKVNNLEEMVKNLTQIMTNGNNSNIPQKALFSFKEASELIGISKCTLHRWIVGNVVTPQRNAQGNVIGIPRGEIMRLMEKGNAPQQCTPISKKSKVPNRIKRIAEEA